MTPASEDLRNQIHALEPSLLAWANALTHDEVEAHALLRQTVTLAMAPDQAPPGDAAAIRSWLHGLLRRAFHSVERDRNTRRFRSAAVTQLGRAQKQDQLMRAAVEQADAR